MVMDTDGGVHDIVTEGKVAKTSRGAPDGLLATPSHAQSRPKLAHALSGLPAPRHFLQPAARAHGTHEQFSPMLRQRFMASAHVALWPLTVVSRRKVATQRPQYLEVVGSQAEA